MQSRSFFRRLISKIDAPYSNQVFIRTGKQFLCLYMIYYDHSSVKGTLSTQASSISEECVQTGGVVMTPAMKKVYKFSSSGNNKLKALSVKVPPDDLPSEKIANAGADSSAMIVTNNSVELEENSFTFELSKMRMINDPLKALDMLENARYYTSSALSMT